MRRRFSLLVVLAFLLPVAGVVTAASAASANISDLAWMTGDWSGPAGPGTLEEHWIEPRDGSISALVRMTGNGSTSMIELIVIEQEGDSLVLRVQQWNPGFAPRSEEPQTMSLVSSEPNRVQFEATSEGGMKSLGYSRDGENFSIHVGTAQGQEFTIPLKAMK